MGRILLIVSDDFQAEVNTLPSACLLAMYRDVVSTLLEHGTFFGAQLDVLVSSGISSGLVDPDAVQVDLGVLVVKNSQQRLVHFSKLWTIEFASKPNVVVSPVGGCANPRRTVGAKAAAAFQP